MGKKKGLLWCFVTVELKFKDEDEKSTLQTFLPVFFKTNLMGLLYVLKAEDVLHSAGSSEYNLSHHLLFTL
jgi:hypothetical protein